MEEYTVLVDWGALEGLYKAGSLYTLYEGGDCDHLTSEVRSFPWQFNT